MYSLPVEFKFFVFINFIYWLIFELFYFFFYKCFVTMLTIACNWVTILNLTVWVVSTDSHLTTFTSSAVNLLICYLINLQCLLPKVMFSSVLFVFMVNFPLLSWSQIQVRAHLRHRYTHDTKKTGQLVNPTWEIVQNGVITELLGRETQEGDFLCSPNCSDQDCLVEIRLLRVSEEKT